MAYELDQGKRPGPAHAVGHGSPPQTALQVRGEEGAGDLTSLADQIAERELGPGHDAYVLDDGVDD